MTKQSPCGPVAEDSWTRARETERLRCQLAAVKRELDEAREALGSEKHAPTLKAGIEALHAGNLRWFHEAKKAHAEAEAAGQRLAALRALVTRRLPSTG